VELVRMGWGREEGREMERKCGIGIGTSSLRL
jgi:hypothetical protein